MTDQYQIYLTNGVMLTFDYSEKLENYVQLELLSDAKTMRIGNQVIVKEHITHTNIQFIEKDTHADNY